MQTDDMGLVREYARRNSEEAFATLVAIGIVIGRHPQRARNNDCQSSKGVNDLRISLNDWLTI